MTSTPSKMACSTAAMESEPKQPLEAAHLVGDDRGAGGHAGDRASVDAEDRRLVDDGAGRRAGGVGAVAVAVASGVGVHLAALDEVVGVDEGVAADHLVVAREHVGARGERVVAEVALDGAALGVGGGGRQVPVVGEGRVLGPGAAVEGSEHDALTGGCLPTQRRPHGRRADELGARVRLELPEVVGLDGDDAVDLQQIVRPVGGDPSGDTAVHHPQALSDGGGRNGVLDPRDDLALAALHVQGVGAALGGAPREGLARWHSGRWRGRRRCRRGSWRCRRSRT